MRLQEMDKISPTKQAVKILESRLGSDININAMTLDQSSKMLTQVKRLVAETRSTRSIHTSEQNPAYLKLIMLDKALTSHVREMRQKNSNKRRLSESEINQAQVVLAAKDMADRVQKMAEDIAEMQYKDLPAVVDQARGDLGTEQAYFPDGPNVGEYVLRTDYMPNVLYRWDGNKWVIVNEVLRAPLTGNSNQTQLGTFINNKNTTKLSSGQVIDQRQALSKIFSPKSDF